MKIIERVEKPGKHVPGDEVWVGQQVTCSHCFSVLQLQAGDDVKIVRQERCIGGEVVIALTCAVCREVTTATFKAGVVGQALTRGAK